MTRTTRTWTAVLLAAVIAGCTEKGPPDVPEIEREFPPPPIAPESLLAAIEVIYNDRTHTVEERLAAYGSLLDSAFVLDAGMGPLELPIRWGSDFEVVAHRALFDAQSRGTVTSIDLRLTYDAAKDLDPPEPGRQGWQEVFVRQVYLRIMFGPIEGLEANGTQCDLLFPPPIEGRYWIGAWNEFAGPGHPIPPGIWDATWAEIKAQFAGRP